VSSYSCQYIGDLSSIYRDYPAMSGLNRYQGFEPNLFKKINDSYSLTIISYEIKIVLSLQFSRNRKLRQKDRTTACISLAPVYTS